MSEMSMEQQVSEVLADAREKAKRHASTLADDKYLQTRLYEIEESLLALARTLDDAFEQIERLKPT